MPVTPSSQPRTTDTHALPSSVSSSSLTSSFSSSRASSDLLPAAPPSSSSQSDILTSDRSVSSQTSSSKPRFFPLALNPGAAAGSRSKPPSTMGQSQARPAAPSPPPLSPAPSTTSSASNRLKRAWAGRRKKSEDISAMFTSTDRTGRESDWEGAATRAPPSAMPNFGELKLERPPSRGGGGPKLLNLPSVFGGRKASLQKPLPQPVPDLRSPPPPPPPPKPAAAAPVTRLQTAPVRSSSRARSSEAADSGAFVATEAAPSAHDADKVKETKEDWRKSDATMASHSTIRPGALSGNRSPRPVSLAESSHSGNTIVPPVNKRLSALITDAEFTMFEETDGTVSECETSSRHPASGRPSPTGSLKARNRRSASLSLVPSRTSGKSSPPVISQSRNFTDAPLSTTRDTPTLTRTAAAGIISPVTSPGSTQTTGNDIRGRLAAWTAVPAIATPPPPHAQVERPLPNLPPPQPRRQPGAFIPPPVNPTFRQTAVSMTGSLAPAAGLAMGFGKRAVEKVGRAWGGLTSSASNHSGYSSSSSTGMSDSASVYAPSHHSGPTGRKGRRKAPHAFSNASSISSLTSSSSEDHFVPPGPHLGRRLRGPKLSSSGLSIVGGLLFKRDLRSAVRETAIDAVSTRLASGEEQAEVFGFRPLESRSLPALVVRCAQHILRWGIQEEGLFRISGRSSHVAKLRSEFDAGCDYNLIEADPSDLDPHAVSSIFKTFLRELPAPILTTDLLHYFESALADEHGRRIEDVTQQPLPSHPTPGLRKPPSLSTLAMPTFAGVRVISEAQRTAFSWLISQLPQENRDLIFTVVELIKATAGRSKETKMPLGNLMLVFCPSLNMSPSLLRVLCEVEGIWDGPPAQPAVLQAVQEATGNSPVVEAPAPQHSRSVSRTMTPSIDLRLPVIELDDVPDNNTKDSPDDAASFVSALERTSNGPSRTPSPLIYGSTVPPLSSSDSLDSSSVSEELVSPDPPSARDAGDSKSLASANSLAIPDTSPSFISPRTKIAVPFPSAGGSVPHSPIKPTALSHKKSFTLLSFPHLRSESAPNVTTEDEQLSPNGPLRRVKRPSLHLLFTKKSTSSLPSATGSSGNTSAVSLSASSACATATSTRPAIHFASSPPRLDTSISSSPIELGFQANVNQLRGTREVSSTVRSAPATVVDPLKLDVPALSQRSDSGGSSVFSTPQSTPIADFYRGRTTSLFLPDTAGELAPPQQRARSASQASDTPSIDVDVAEMQDDWTRSVLLAAEASGEAS
ncbi:RhoGAP-domain-containing protein [Dichomitus squalens LYAD-421 SS1]|uniref:RhoGAP-domain-containing protein n=1 Tax=Dichomitus squalens TaxID=114155 RepID=A0A4Q9QAF7_9APHY|nr:RhoGAP-domain-containing protein [Dichomitus squalens LYAD-421 SS1]EJF65136.1 RhoGAP-domain-containing protein [Dichomitus squalens LYAD-421 SS1]TBU64569.1 RhoGAP-domain-containing protein [Dichomitus squalens]